MFDLPIAEEIHGSVASDVAVAVLGLGAVQTAEGKGLSWHRDTDVHTEHGGAES